jgi:hypothetical protein
VAFKKEVQEDFHIPDGEDETYLGKLLSKGQPEQELLDEGWEIDRVESVKQNFSTSPNDESYQDNSFYRVRYKYSLNSNIKQSSIIPTTRQFCRELIQKNYVWRIEEVENEINSFGQSAQFWRGGYNCRHEWYRIFYKKSGDITNKSSVNRNKITGGGFPIELSPEWIQPDTVTDKTMNNPSKSTVKNLGLSKERFEVGVPHYTEDGKLYEGPTHKGPDGRLMTGKVHTEDSVYLYHEDELDIEPNPCWEGYEPIGLNDDGSPRCVPIKENMESVSDYPDSVKNNAKAVLKYVDENGWGSCGTEVGKIRANQLAKGEPISIDTVKRMYSYLSRHEVDLESSKGYGDGCGKLMYDSWGGKSALSWAESKLKNFGYDITTLPVYVDELPKKKKKDMSKQYFATDSEKHIVLGPAMVPNQKIFRKDNEGNPYYVFFSSPTIAMIAQKYMKNKYTDNNDMMHDGRAVDDVHVLESWIKESNNDKSSDYGFENLPVGTWFVSMKINNPEIWDKVKDGTLNGFSVSGFFEEVAKFTKEEMFLYQVAEILKKY